ncbi:hypothetical protein [Saccharopolyspora phatthalungensis]|uniref:Uncharacterized protein n=1 Tax=Saccharopolyspora phatthalungensis TaxID=664693 RepID=A0A840Q154_9PSEU|nr:hypothetical protein [Saccharopolyspora phatthalungensis]MBB5153727.1 hypothetical protein [Saccharopolyspora phatthalungensis]
MLREFPPPPRAAENSMLIKKRLAEVRNAGGTRETVTVDWNGQLLSVEVIDLPLASLYYNPATHRVRAQRSHDPVRDKTLNKDPYSDESQDYLKFLLQAEPKDPRRRDTDFDALRQSLKDFGQSDPGLITHQGVLVNGNTRAAALRELGVQSMRVAVLPESFTWADINAVELSLQLRKDHRRAYSYINRLLAMEEQAALGKTPEAIAKEFRIQRATYEQEKWILAAIREQIKRSKSADGRAALRLIDFEDHQEKLKELHRAHQNAQADDPDRADVLKEIRMAAIVLGFAKTAVRHIDESFPETYLNSTLPGELSDVAAEQEAVAVPGLGISIPGESAGLTAARALNKHILRAKAVAVAAASDVPEAEKRSAQGLIDKAQEAFQSALDTAEGDAKVRKRKQQAPARLAEACRDIDQCVVDLVRARASQTLDEEAFDEAVVELRHSIQKLARQAGRGIPHPGDGVAWLLEAASLEGK